MILVSSLSGLSQTIDGVAITAYAKQYRAGSAASLTTALAAAVAAKTIMVNDVDVPNADILIAAAALTAGQSGKTLYLDLAGGFAVTLPPAAPGLKFNFIVKTAPTTAYTIVTNASANIIKGLVTTANVQAAGAADSETAGGDTISFVAATAVAGDKVTVECDGTSWHMVAACAAVGGVTITTAS